jgi:DNA-directed RNA polymerase specialized sigma24 family protein
VPRRHRLADKRVLRPAETALALDLIGENDLLRLKTIARFYARGLPPDVAWDDLLQEAMTRVLTGARRSPDSVPMVAFLAGVMRSLKSEHWRRVLKESRDQDRLRLERATDESREAALTDPAPDPERSLIARQAINAIERLFSDDPVALKIIGGLGEGLSAEQIRIEGKITKIDYDSARRRMRRIFLREGLTCEPG